jgi:hypothetical protein
MKVKLNISFLVITVLLLLAHAEARKCLDDNAGR